MAARSHISSHIPQRSNSPPRSHTTMSHRTSDEQESPRADVGRNPGPSRRFHVKNSNTSVHLDVRRKDQIKNAYEALSHALRNKGLAGIDDEANVDPMSLPSPPRCVRVGTVSFLCPFPSRKRRPRSVFGIPPWGMVVTHTRHGNLHGGVSTCPYFPKYSHGRD